MTSGDRLMPLTGHLIDVIVILAAAVVALIALRRVSISPVLGYLAAGAAIGPYGLHLVGDVESARALAEFGVVFLLFTIGLELPLERLKVLSPMLFGMGIAQVAVTALALGGLALAVGLPVEAAIVVGLALALSSTVFVIQILTETRRLATRFGRSAFAVLLMQDLAIGPILVITIALIEREGGLGPSLAIAALKACVAIVVIFALGRYVLRPLFNLAAVARTEETFAAMTLLVVLCTAALTDLAGLSLALGGLLSGMLLAETQYRHQVAAEIRPFRGLLLGLFFMTIGMATDLGHAVSDIGPILAIAIVLIAAKAAILAGLALLFGLPRGHALPLGLLLAQGGEFAFVVFSLAAGGGLLGEPVDRTLTVAVALSMLLTPALSWASTGVARRAAARSVADADILGRSGPAFGDHVVIAGYGRVGQTVAKRLSARGVAHIAVDRDPNAVARARAQDEPVFFGDATRPDVLESLHVGAARAVVVALSDPAAATRLVGLLHYILPERPILARAETEDHARELIEAGARTVVPELVATGDRLAALVLEDDAPRA